MKEFAPARAYSLVRRDLSFRRCECVAYTQQRLRTRAARVILALAVSLLATTLYDVSPPRLQACNIVASNVPRYHCGAWISMSKAEVLERTEKYVRDNFLYARPDFTLAPNEPLIRNGILDSMGVMELI